MAETVFVERFATELEAEILRGRLEADGIETWSRGAGAASTMGAINELNLSWDNPLGGVEVRVRPEDAAEAHAVAREIYGRKEREKQSSPNLIQVLIGIGIALFAWQAGASIHPALGIVLGLAVLVGTFIIARK